MTLGRLERLLMERLWAERSEVTVRRLQETLNTDLAYTSSAASSRSPRLPC
jgi:predicted transcriptional regulator